MVPYAGWEMPVQFAGVTEEHRAVRSAAGLFDTSHMGELRVQGRCALDVINHVITNDARRIADGQALYTCACNPEGTILDDLIVYRIHQGQWLVVCNASNREKIAVHFKRAAAERCDLEVEDVSSATAMLALQGPRALAVAERAGGLGATLAALPSFWFCDVPLANIACTVARTGYTGEDGLEIFCAAGDAPQLYRALLVLGKPEGLVPAGLAARDTLRLEARLPLYGNDIDETTNPFEAGLGWVVKLDKGDFFGRDALSRAKAEGLSRTLVGFEMVGRGIARHGYPLLDMQGVRVGVCTSGSPAPSLGKNIGLGYVPPAHSAIGTPLLVDCRGRPIEARVVPTPFYRRAHERKAS